LLHYTLSSFEPILFPFFFDKPITPTPHYKPIKVLLISNLTSSYISGEGYERLAYGGFVFEGRDILLVGKVDLIGYICFDCSLDCRSSINIDRWFLRVINYNTTSGRIAQVIE